MITPFLVTNGLFGYVDGTIQCPPATIQQSSSSVRKETTPPPMPQTNPEFTAWVANDAHVRMVIESTISETSYPQIQGTTARDLWLSLESAYAPHTAS